MKGSRLALGTSTRNRETGPIRIRRNSEKPLKGFGETVRIGELKTPGDFLDAQIGCLQLVRGLVHLEPQPVGLRRCSKKTAKETAHVRVFKLASLRGLLRGSHALKTMVYIPAARIKG